MKNSIKKKKLTGLLLMLITIPFSLQAQGVTIQVNTPEVAPEWALLQRQLLDVSSQAAEEF